MIHLCTAWYDSRGGAARLIESVRAQTSADWTWHVSVDPAAPDKDGLAELQTAAALDPRIIVKVQAASTAPYIGAAKDDAFKMIAETSGLCAWVDADDWLEPEALATLEAAAKDTLKAWLVTWSFEHYAGAPEGPRMTHPRLDLPTLTAKPGAITHMESFRIECLSAEPWDRELTCLERWDLHVRFWTRYGAPLFIPKALYHYRRGIGRYDKALSRKSLARIRAKHTDPAGSAAHAS